MIRTEIMPTYDVRPVMPTLIQGLELRMMDLAFGEQSDVLDLCSRLADAYEEWIIEKERRDRHSPRSISRTVAGLQTGT